MLQAPQGLAGLDPLVADGLGQPLVFVEAITQELRQIVSHVVHRLTTFVMRAAARR
ncbi:hypothetical protein [Streptomyces sp. NPDC002205]|uniref:hypothetical protein n=1 Tax=Streptomyces sp. NPDC002205 TaxID=3154411 RepID=UPI0033263C09